MNMSKFEYADVAALADHDAATATTRVTAIAVGSLNGAAIAISEKKSKAMDIHPTTGASAKKEAEVVALKRQHACDRCSGTFPTLKGLGINVSRWSDGGLTQRSCRGSKADRAVTVVKKRAAEALLDQVHVGNTDLEKWTLSSSWGENSRVMVPTKLVSFTAWR